MLKRSLLLKLSTVFVIIGMTVATYIILIRPRQLRWGASAEELARAMPGDELVLSPSFKATRAVTIEGSPETIWPWLVQMGYGRAGFYGYDLIENLGSERGLRSAERIIPELQQLAVGDSLPISAIASLTVQNLEPNHFLVWADASSSASSAIIWALYPVDEAHTRLISRASFQYHWTEPWLVIDLFTDFADHIAVRKILLGIKDRVEGRVEPLAVQNIEIALWLVATLGYFAALIFILIKNIPQMPLIALAAAAILFLTLYIHPPLWAGVLLEGLLLIGLVTVARAASSFQKAVSAIYLSLGWEFMGTLANGNNF